MLLICRHVALVSLLLPSGCGQPLTSRAELNADLADYRCQDATYDVTALRSADGKFRRVLLSGGLPSAPLRDFSTWDDLTPQGRSDISFRGRFHAKTTADDAYLVDITRGGFTLGVDAKVYLRVLSEPTGVDALTCLPR